MPVERRLPIRTNSQHNVNEAHPYDKVDTRSQIPPESYQRHSSIPGRHGDTTHTATYSTPHALTLPTTLDSYAVIRSDGHTPRSSSLMENSLSRDIPQSSSRHNASQNIVQDRRDRLDETSGSLGRTTTRDRHASQGSYGNMNVHTAARDTKRNYVQKDFPTIWEWKQYNDERADYEAQILQSQRHKDDFSAENFSADEYTDEDAIAPRHLQRVDMKTLKQDSGTAHRHDDIFIAEDIGRQSVEPKASRQGSTWASRHDSNYPAKDISRQMVETKAPRQASTTTRHHDDDGNYYTENPPRTLPPSGRRHEIATTSQSRDAYGREAPIIEDKIEPRRIPRPEDSQYDSDDVIGHGPEPFKGPVGAQKPSKSSKKETEAISRATASTKSGTTSRHEDREQAERRGPILTQVTVSKSSSKDQRKVSTSVSKGASRHRRESDNRSSKAPMERNKPFRDEERLSEDYDSSSEEDVVVHPNSKRPRGPGYKDRHRYQ